MISRGLAAHAEVGFEENLVAAAEVFDVNAGDGAVGNGDQGSFIGADAGGAQADIFDCASAIAEAAIVADADHFVAENRDAAEQILNRLLRTETDGQPANAQAGERGREV